MRDPPLSINTHACLRYRQMVLNQPRLSAFPSSAFKLQTSTFNHNPDHTLTASYQQSPTSTKYGNRPPISLTWVTRTSQKAYRGSFILPQTLIVSIIPPEALPPAVLTRSQRNLTRQHCPHPLLVVAGVY